MQNGDLASGYVGKTTLFGLALVIRRERRIIVFGGISGRFTLRFFGVCDESMNASSIGADSLIVGEEKA